MFEKTFLDSIRDAIATQGTDAELKERAQATTRELAQLRVCAPSVDHPDRLNWNNKHSDLMDRLYYIETELEWRAKYRRVMIPGWNGWKHR